VLRTVFSKLLNIVANRVKASLAGREAVGVAAARDGGPWPGWRPAAAWALRLAVAAVPGALTCAPAAGADAEAKATPQAELRCEGVRAVVHGGSRADAAMICAGARDAAGFFSGLGLRAAVDVQVEIAAALPEKASPSAVGCYVPASRRAYMLSYADFAKHGDWFGIAIEPALYRSVAAHEIAHALAACFFRDPQPSLAAVEYVGYVAMFSAMASDLRQRVLDRNPGTGFDRDEQINTTIYLIDPVHFGVASYRHYLRPEAGARYLRALLAGEVRLE
jgi:hypothetical protein